MCKDIGDQEMLNWIYTTRTTDSPNESSLPDKISLQRSKFKYKSKIYWIHKKGKGRRGQGAGAVVSVHSGGCGVGSQGGMLWISRWGGGCHLWCWGVLVNGVVFWRERGNDDLFLLKELVNSCKKKNVKQTIQSKTDLTNSYKSMNYGRFHASWSRFCVGPWSF